MYSAHNHGSIETADSVKVHSAESVERPGHKFWPLAICSLRDVYK
jgi:hypothetical protein